MRSSRLCVLASRVVAVAVLSAAWLVVAAAPARADGAGEPIGFEVTVVHVSSEPGGVAKDPRARRIDGLLGKKIRYESLRVLTTERRSVGLNEIGSVTLPTGQRFRFRPIDQGPQGVLIAVDMDAAAQGDFRVPKGKPIVLGGNAYEDGQLVVILEHTD